MMHILAFLIALTVSLPAWAVELTAPFENIEGGSLRVSQWSGQPVLVVNTASRCGYTDQYAGLQKLYDTYKAKGLVVLTVPSNDFRQELSSNADVKEFCELQYGIDLPMTGITPVLGDRAHPFYTSLREEVGFVPKWNFNKVLIGPDGRVVATYRSDTRPMSSKLRNDVERLLQ